MVWDFTKLWLIGKRSFQCRWKFHSLITAEKKKVFSYLNDSLMTTLIAFIIHFFFIVKLLIAGVATNEKRFQLHFYCNRCRSVDVDLFNWRSGGPENFRKNAQSRVREPSAAQFKRASDRRGRHQVLLGVPFHSTVPFFWVFVGKFREVPINWIEVNWFSMPFFNFLS